MQDRVSQSLFEKATVYVDCVCSRTRYRLRPRSPLATSPNAPGVSILRPLKGLDTNLFENLESTFCQEYPNFEILLSVADEDDQALTVVRELMSEYPQVNAKIIVGAHVTRKLHFSQTHVFRLQARRLLVSIQK